MLGCWRGHPCYRREPCPAYPPGAVTAFAHPPQLSWAFASPPGPGLLWGWAVPQPPACRVVGQILPSKRLWCYGHTLAVTLLIQFQCCFQYFSPAKKIFAHYNAFWFSYFNLFAPFMKIVHPRESNRCCSWWEIFCAPQKKAISVLARHCTTCFWLQW